MSVVVAEGVVEVTADGKHIPRDIAKDIDDNRKDVDDSGEKMGGGLSAGIGKGLMGLGKVTAVALGAVALAVGAGVGAIVVKGVQFDAAMQNYEAGFTPLLGGADAAHAKLAELSQFAASTPFELSGLAQASQTMLSFGETNANLLPDLKMLGDISQGNQDKLSGLALVFGQVQSTGHLMGQDVLQMINQGFNPLVEISKMTGESMTEVKTRMEAGAISFDEVRAAMQHATSEGGMFFGSMDLGAKTLTGAWSSTQDGANILSGSITSALTPALTGILNDGINPLLGGLVGLVNGTDGAQAAVDSASTALITQVTNLGPAIQSLVGNLSTVFTAIGPAVGSAVGILVGSLTTILPAVVGIAGSIVTSLIGALSDNAGTLVAGAVPVIFGFVNGLLAQLPTLIQVGLNVLVALMDGITQALPTTIPAIVTAVIQSIAQLFDPGNLTQLLQSGLALVMGLVQGILAALPQLIAALPAIILGIITFVIGAIPQVIQAGISLLTALIGALPVIIDALVAAIPQIIVGLITAVIGAIPQLIKAGISLFIALIKDLPTIIVTLVNAIPQIITGIVKAFTDPKTIGQLAKAGLQLIQGLWSGISDAASWLWGKVSGFMGGLVNNIKGFFGIHSPSKLFEDEIGAMLPAGMANGIIAGYGDVSNAVAGLNDAAMSGLVGGGITVTARGGPGAGLGDGITVSAPPRDSTTLAGAGTTIVIQGDVVLDAQSVEDFTDVVDMIKALPQVARAGKGGGGN